MPTMHDWDDVAQRNMESGNPFLLHAIGPVLDFDTFLRMLSSLPEHTFFRAMTVLPGDADPYRAFYIFRCTCQGPNGYDATMFERKGGNDFTREAFADWSPTKVFMWLANRGVTMDMEWEIIPVPEGRQP